MDVRFIAPGSTFGGDAVKIVYHCYGGAHSSVVAAGIHLGRVPTDRIPTAQELQRIPLFDGPVGKDHGLIRFMGRDEFGNDIYTLGRRNAGKQIERVLHGLAELVGGPKDLVMVDVLSYVNWIMVVGGYTSRKLGLVTFGRPIVTWGVQHFFWDIASVVQRVKMTVASDNLLTRGR